MADSTSAQTIADLAVANADAEKAIDATKAAGEAATRTNNGLVPIAARLKAKRAQVAALRAEVAGSR